MKKIALILTIAIITLNSCNIFLGDDPEPDYVGDWIRTIETTNYTTTSYELTIDTDSYSLSQVTRIIISGDEDTYIKERGTVSERSSSELRLTKTHERDVITEQLLQIPTQYQVPRTVGWYRSGDTLTLVDNSINSSTNGDFQRD